MGLQAAAVLWLGATGNATAVTGGVLQVECKLLQLAGMGLDL